ncbi:MAG: hypothetical protein NTX22_09925 [Ignavibacteriales bacterium]|nr:hypothetical protein [Ignavibacteriales bacterium]
MISEIEIKYVKVVCPHCGKKSNEVLVMTYESSNYIRIIYMCVDCKEVIKISEEGFSKNQQLVPTS